MARLIQNLEMLRGIWNGDSGTNYSEKPGIATRLDTSAFDGEIEYFFEVSMYNFGDEGVTTAYVELYNHTDGVSVEGSEITTTRSNGCAQRLRSGSIALSGDKIYTVRIKHSVSGMDTMVLSARIIVVQTGNITKTQIHNELGCEELASSTSPTNRFPEAMHFLYEASKYDGTITIRHEAVMEVTSGNTSYSSLYDETAGEVVANSIASSSAAGFAHVSSGNVTLIDGHVYRPTAYVSGGGGIFFESSKIVITAVNFTKFLSYVSLLTLTASTSNTSYRYEADYQQHFGTGEFTGCYVIYYFEALLSISNAAQTASLMLTIIDNETCLCYNTDAVVTRTGTTSPGRERIGGSTLSAGAFEYGTAIKSSGGSATASCSNAYLVQEVINIDQTGNVMALFE